MLPRDVGEFLALDYLDSVEPTLIYLASPYAHPSASVREARLDAVRHVCGKLVNEGKIVLSPMVYSGELAVRGFHPPQGWYAWDLQFLGRADELLVLQLPGWEESRSAGGDSGCPGQEFAGTPHAAGTCRTSSGDCAGTVRGDVVNWYMYWQD